MAACLLTLTTLTKLDFSRTSHCVTRCRLPSEHTAGIHGLAAVLPNLVNMRHLVVDDHLHVHSAADLFASCLPALTALTALSMEGVQITQNVLEALNTLPRKGAV